MIRTALLAAAAALCLSGPALAHAHGGKPHSHARAAAADAALAKIIAEGARDAEDKARDGDRRPLETLKFWGVKPNMTVVELGSGGGYWTDILSQYLATGGGKLIVTFGDPDAMTEQQRTNRDNFMRKYLADPKTYGTVETGVFALKTDKPIAPAGSADMVISSRNFHGWLLFGMKDKALKDIHNVLKPGGLVAVEQHRADATKPQDPRTGYVRQDYVITEYRKAGFEFVGSSEINANPRDTKDHPFGVWTLPPNLRGSPNGQPAAPSPDEAKYRAIGESDRMLLVFRKPAA